MTIVAAMVLPPVDGINDRTVMMSDCASHLPSGSRYVDSNGKLKKFAVVNKDKNTTYDLIIGSCGTGLISTFTQQEFKPPEIIGSEDVRHYVYKCMSEWKKQATIDELNKGALFDSSGALNGMMLIAFMGRLFYCFGDFSIQEAERNYAAIGIGEDIAFGVIAATFHYNATLTDKEAMDAMQFVGKVAVRHVCDIGAPYVFEFALFSG